MAQLLRPDVQKELAITAEQRKKLEDIRFNSEKESIQHRAAIQIQHMELSRLMEADNPDRAAIDKKLQELAQEESALLRSSIYTRLNSRAVLTAEQRAKLAQFWQNRMGRGRPLSEGGRAREERAPMPDAPAKQ
jgi:Spy/CpxP family protein refolding chaperone